MRMIQSVPLLDMRFWVHAGLTAVLSGFAAILWQSAQTMRYPGWGQFMALADEPTWATIFMAASWVGVIGMVAKSEWLRIGCVLAISLAHGAMALGFYMAPVPPGQTISTGVVAYGVFAALGVLLFVRRLHDALQEFQ